MTYSTSLRSDTTEINSLTLGLSTMSTDDSPVKIQFLKLLKPNNTSTLSKNLCPLLDERKNEFTPIELACAIWTLLKLPLNATQKQTLASSILLFAQKIFNIQSYSQTQWNEAHYLFTGTPKFSEVAAFLEQEAFDETTLLSHAFIYETWTALSHCFCKNNALESHQIQDVVIEHCLQSWITTTLPSLKDGISSLLLVYAMCTSERTVGWNLATLAKQPQYIHFIHSAISACAGSHQVLAHYTEFAEVLEDTNQEQALKLLLSFILFEMPNTIQSQEQCLTTLDFTKSPSCFDVDNVAGFLRNSTTYSISFLQPFFERLQAISTTTNKELLESIKVLFELMMSSNWHLCPIPTTHQPNQLYKSMHEASSNFIFITTEPLIATFHKRRSADHEAVLNDAKKQYILTLLHSLQHAEDHYKRAAIKTIFTLYKEIKNTSIKTELFEKLAQILTKTTGISVKLACNEETFTLCIDHKDKLEEGPTYIDKP